MEDEIDSEIHEQVVDEKSSPEMIDEIILDTKPSLAPYLQPPNGNEGQIADESMEAKIHDLMMQEDSVPFCFEAFQFIKQNLRKSLRKKMNNQ